MHSFSAFSPQFNRNISFIFHVECVITALCYSRLTYDMFVYLLGLCMWTEYNKLANANALINLKFERAQAHVIQYTNIHITLAHGVWTIKMTIAIHSNELLWTWQTLALIKCVCNCSFVHYALTPIYGEEKNGGDVKTGQTRNKQRKKLYAKYQPYGEREREREQKRIEFYQVCKSIINTNISQIYCFDACLK